MRTSQRKSEVPKKIGPGLDEKSLCEKSHIELFLCVKTEQKRKEMGGIIAMPR